MLPFLIHLITWINKGIEITIKGHLKFPLGSRSTIHFITSSYEHMQHGKSFKCDKMIPSSLLKLSRRTFYYPSLSHLSICLLQSKHYPKIINILCAQAVEIYDVYLLISIPPATRLIIIIQQTEQHNRVIWFLLRRINWIIC